MYGYVAYDGTIYPDLDSVPWQSRGCARTATYLDYLAATDNRNPAARENDTKPTAELIAELQAEYEAENAEAEQKLAKLFAN